MRCSLTTYGRMEFPEKLKRLMGEHRLSQAAIGNRIDRSQALIGKWTRGESYPDIRDASRLAALLGVDVDYLADDSRSEPTPTSFSDAERQAVDMVRSLGLTKDQVIRRLATPPGTPATAGEHRRLPDAIITEGNVPDRGRSVPPKRGDRTG
jgi:transcriptional regulator with XRE-family HTH domain